METFAQRFQRALFIRGLKQVDVCEKTGISSSIMSCYAKGRYVPKKQNLTLIAIALNVSEEWLLGKDVPMSNPYVKLMEAYAAIPDDYQDMISLLQHPGVMDMIKLFLSMSSDKQQAALAMMKGLSGK